MEGLGAWLADWLKTGNGCLNYYMRHNKVSDWPIWSHKKQSQTQSDFGGRHLQSLEQDYMQFYDPVIEHW